MRLPLAPRSSPRASESSRDLGDGTRLKVGDLARESGKTVRAIHLYEELNLLRPIERSKGGYRLYGPDAVLRIRWIGKMQEMGFSLTDVQAVVREWEEESSASKAMVQMRDVFRSKLEQTRKHIAELSQLERELCASLEYLETCQVCDPARVVSACGQCDLHECDEHVPELVAGFHAHG